MAQPQPLQLASISAPSALLGTTMNRRERGGVLSGSDGASSLGWRCCTAVSVLQHAKGVSSQPSCGSRCKASGPRGGALALHPSAARDTRPGARQRAPGVRRVGQQHLEAGPLPIVQRHLVQVFNRERGRRGLVVLDVGHPLRRAWGRGVGRAALGPGQPARAEGPLGACWAPPTPPSSAAGAAGAGAGPHVAPPSIAAGARERVPQRPRGRPRGRWRPRQADSGPQPQSSITAGPHLFPEVFRELDAAKLFKHPPEELGLRAGAGAAGRRGAGAGRPAGLTLVLRPATTKSLELTGSSMESDMVQNPPKDPAHAPPLPAFRGPGWCRDPPLLPRTPFLPRPPPIPRAAGASCREPGSQGGGRRRRRSAAAAERRAGAPPLPLRAHILLPPHGCICHIRWTRQRDGGAAINPGQRPKMQGIHGAGQVVASVLQRGGQRGRLPTTPLVSRTQTLPCCAQPANGQAS